MSSSTVSTEPAPRTIVLDENMREVLRLEAEYLSASVGDNIAHLAGEDHPVRVLREEKERLSLAMVLWTAVEVSALNGLAQTFYMQQIVDMVGESLREYRDELKRDRDAAQAFIVRGEDSGHGWVGMNREESLAEYERQRRRVKEEIAGRERFLELVQA